MNDSLSSAQRAYDAQTPPEATDLDESIDEQALREMRVALAWLDDAPESVAEALDAVDPMWWPKVQDAWHAARVEQLRKEADEAAEDARTEAALSREEDRAWAGEY